MAAPIKFNSNDIDERAKEMLIYMDGYTYGFRDGLKDGWNDCIDALKKLKNEKDNKVIFRKLEEVKNEKV